MQRRSALPASWHQCSLRWVLSATFCLRLPPSPAAVLGLDVWSQRRVRGRLQPAACLPVGTLQPAEPWRVCAAPQARREDRSDFCTILYPALLCCIAVLHLMEEGQESDRMKRMRLCCCN